MGIIPRFFQSQRRAIEFRWPVEASRRHKQLISKYAAHTMTGNARQWALLNAVESADRLAISGDIVECGVWRGGNMMMVKEARQASAIKRELYLFDTFSGMTEPDDRDVSYRGEAALSTFQAARRSDHTDWCYAPIEDVRQGFERFGLGLDGVTLIKGPVEHTLLDEANLPTQIAILRLDTDWYSSTKTELEILYPRLSMGGILIIDDYGHWQGARRAVDEYFGAGGPMLVPVDYTCRLAVKVG